MLTPSRALIAGSLILLCACTQESYVFDVTASDDGSGRPVFSWDGDPARQVDVYRCDEGCPDEAELPSYVDEPVPFEGRDDIVSVWSVTAMTGVEAGEGAIPSPVEYGVLRDDVGYETGEAADPLEPSAYAVRVVLGQGDLFSATFGTAWATFVIDEL